MSFFAIITSVFKPAPSSVPGARVRGRMQEVLAELARLSTSVSGESEASGGEVAGEEMSFFAIITSVFKPAPSSDPGARVRERGCGAQRLF